MRTLSRVAWALAVPLSALVVAIGVTSLVIAGSGNAPGDFLSVLLDPPKPRLYVNIINQTSVLFLSATAAAIGFRMNLFNIGVEGQYTVAAYVAALVAAAAWLPGLANVVFCLLVAMATGAAWAGIAAVLKVTRGVSEVISTIMLNAIGIGLVGYLVNRYGERTGDSRRTTPIEESSQVEGWEPGFFDTAGNQVWLLAGLAVVVGVGFWFVVNKTVFGFDLRATGMSESAAVASGVKVKRMVLASMLLSGAVAGLIWMPELFGDAYYYSDTVFQNGLGFAGIAVALLGRNRPLGMFFGALLFAYLSVQSTRLELETDISPSVVQITQGVIVLSVVVAYEVLRRRQRAAESRAVAQGAAAGPAGPPGGPAKGEEVPA